MSLILDLQTGIEHQITIFCDDYCKYSKECAEYYDSLFCLFDEKPYKNEIIENCPLMKI